MRTLNLQNHCKTFSFSMFLQIRQFLSCLEFLWKSSFNLASFWLQKSIKITSPSHKSHHRSLMLIVASIFFDLHPFWEAFGKPLATVLRQNKARKLETSLFSCALVYFSPCMPLSNPIWDQKIVSKASRWKKSIWNDPRDFDIPIFVSPQAPRQPGFLPSFFTCLCNTCEKLISHQYLPCELTFCSVHFHV